VLDMACGSGIFLVTALAQLVNWQESTGTTVDLAMRADLARGHLFGVDIDPDAVEVTRLSLLLLVLGDEAVDVATAKNVLPDLSANLKVGNSVVNESFDTLVPDAAADVERRAAVQPFGWMANFPNVLNPQMTARTGFDVVVGNPPYSRIQVLAEHFPDQLTFFQHPSNVLGAGKAYNFDLYMLFLEQGLSLLASDGLLSFVVPHRFMRSPSSVALRKLLGRRIHSIVDFGHARVFPNRDTYTCLLTAGWPSADPVPIVRVDDLDDWQETGAGEQLSIKRSRFGEESWVFYDDATTQLHKEIDARCPRKLEDVADIFVGVQTSRDQLYLVKPSKRAGGFITFTDVNGVKWDVEEDIVVDAILDARLQPYGPQPLPEKVALFPYSIESTKSGKPKAVVHSLATMQSKYPKALAYFEAHKAALLKRKMSPNPRNGEFWAYGRSQSLTKLDADKIIIRTLSLVPQYVIDRTGLLVTGGGDGGPYYLLRPKAVWKQPYEVLVALLSHPLIDGRVALGGKSYQHGYFVHRKAFLKDLPVPDFDAKSAATITKHVQELQSLQLKLTSESDQQKVASMRSRLLVLQDEVEELVATALGVDAAKASAL
jgi:hypothetical protein